MSHESDSAEGTPGNADAPQGPPDSEAVAGAAVVEPANVDDTSKALAVLCHLSMFLSIPIWIVPLITRDNAFTLHHAKDAAVTWALGMTIFVGGLTIFILSCGLLPVFVLVFVLYIPMLMGIFSAANGQIEDIPLITPISRALLGGVTVKPS